MERLIYPITVISDRYCGSYSGGRWIAWHLYPEQVPDGPDDGDCECSSFWRENTLPFGKGDTADDAVKDLMKIIKD